jgi:hypothetical protein
MNQRTILTPDQYYSRGRIIPTVDVDGGSGIATVTYPRDQMDFFGYSFGQPMDPAQIGGTPGQFKATRSDTNLVGSPAQTIGGDHVEIEGLSIQVVPGCFAARAIGKVFAESAVSFYYDGQKLGLLVGPAYFAPGKNGLYGLQQDIMTPTGLDGQVPLAGFVTNGAPTIHNFLRIPERLRWNAAGQVDSNLTVRWESTRDVVMHIPAARAAGVAGATFSGAPTAFVQPTAADLTIDVICLLHSVQTSDRSGNR